ncbi:kinase-like protein [Sistotremastrum suecicum HHB10207 ss-3]|uniref:Kinase-like protein n=1 Tax=Sistotremastrum suecicum HHB10207 ss-3 TaxID=1314776 RepID=A0A166IQ11_9AGAM|nr:kinase-like protein [Sistotremastrum suecicum HHB10207 ss-3]
MLAAASSFLNRSAIGQSYTFVSQSGSQTPPAGSSKSVATVPTFHVGLWRVQHAVHKTTGRHVSVWSFDKRSQDVDKLRPATRERVMEVLKTEATALSRLRHPFILEAVEPLEESRSELTFATEHILSSLALSIPSGPRSSALVDLDEIEILKGVIQVGKGLEFLHTSAKKIHSNLNLQTVLFFISLQGDWKLGGLGLTIPLTQPDGSPTRWEFPTWDSRIPHYTQRSFDFMAPEYAIDEQLDPSSDMYSLGCIIYAVHVRGNPPFKNHGSLQSLRDNAGKPLVGMEKLDPDLQALLKSLITRHPTPRPSPATLSSASVFSSLAISTLNFLERSTFASKPREEKIAFMKGLKGVLDRFSDGLKTRKILPSLLEEMKDTQLLPSILPNIFVISSSLSAQQFASLVLPGLKPLFAIKEPPQNMLTLLDNLKLLQDKTDKNVFKEQVLPLVYNALESEQPLIQEKALGCVPDLCDTIDYAEVQSVLFPRVALVFTKTNILSVKIATLKCFLSMVKTLDQTSLTQKLVPLLSKIRTRVSSSLATLDVQEAMGLKVDREAVASLVLPQLWIMSIGPLLNLSQFNRFMEVIRKLGARVEREHAQHLRDSQRIEDRSTSNVNSTPLPFSANNRALDFESLVGTKGGIATPPTAPDAVPSNSSWEDDVWGSMLGESVETKAVSVIRAPSSQSLPASPHNFSAPPVRASTPRLAAKSPIPPQSSLRTTTTLDSRPSFTIPPPPMAGPRPLSPRNLSPPSQPSKPNYNVLMQPMSPQSGSTVMSPPLGSMLSPSLSASSSGQSFNNILLPTPAQSNWGTQKTNGDWARDFDPLA